MEFNMSSLSNMGPRSGPSFTSGLDSFAATCESKRPSCQIDLFQLSKNTKFSTPDGSKRSLRAVKRSCCLKCLEPSDLVRLKQIEKVERLMAEERLKAKG